MEKHEKAAREKARATALRATQILDSKKGSGITLIELTDETIITDYFVIANGSSTTQVRTLAEEVEFRLGQEGISPLHIEGTDRSGWILLDYGNVIVHVFTREAREFYKLERLWAQGKVTHYEPPEPDDAVEKTSDSSVSDNTQDQIH